MSGPIFTALRDIFLEFDPIILKAGFRNEMVEFGRHHRSLRDIIIEKIIYEQVLPDMSLTAATEEWIPLKSSYIIHKENDAVVVSIPSNVLGNREIIAPMQVANTQLTPTVGRQGRLDMDAERVISHSPNVIGTNSTELSKMQGENVVLLQNFSFVSIEDFSMQCMLGMDKEFSSIPPSYYKLFSKLCSLKLKTYLVARQASLLDIAESNAGVSIPSLRRLIDRWEGSEVTYQEELERWYKHSGNYNDHENAQWIHMTTSFL